MSNQHTIVSQKFVLEYEQNVDSKGIEQAIYGLNEELLAIVSDSFDTISPDNIAVYIPKIILDLGELPAHRFKEEFLKRFRIVLEDALQQQKEIANIEERLVPIYHKNILSEVIVHGNYGVASQESIRTALNQFSASNFIEIAKSNAREVNAMQRLFQLVEAESQKAIQKELKSKVLEIVQRYLQTPLTLLRFFQISGIDSDLSIQQKGIKLKAAIEQQILVLPIPKLLEFLLLDHAIIHRESKLFLDTVYAEIQQIPSSNLSAYFTSRFAKIWKGTPSQRKLLLLHVVEFLQQRDYRYLNYLATKQYITSLTIFEEDATQSVLQKELPKSKLLMQLLDLKLRPKFTSLTSLSNLEQTSLLEKEVPKEWRKACSDFLNFYYVSINGFDSFIHQLYKKLIVFPELFASFITLVNGKQEFKALTEKDFTQSVLLWLKEDPMAFSSFKSRVAVLYGVQGAKWYAYSISILDQIGQGIERSVLLLQLEKLELLRAGMAVSWIKEVQAKLVRRVSEKISKSTSSHSAAIRDLARAVEGKKAYTIPQNLLEEDNLVFNLFFNPNQVDLGTPFNEGFLPLFQGLTQVEKRKILARLFFHLKKGAKTTKLQKVPFSHWVVLFHTALTVLPFAQQTKMQLWEEEMGNRVVEILPKSKLRDAYLTEQLFAFLLEKIPLSTWLETVRMELLENTHSSSYREISRLKRSSVQTLMKEIERGAKNTGIPKNATVIQVLVETVLSEKKGKAAAALSASAVAVRKSIWEQIQKNTLIQNIVLRSEAHTGFQMLNLIIKNDNWNALTNRFIGYLESIKLSAKQQSYVMRAWQSIVLEIPFEQVQHLWYTAFQTRIIPSLLKDTLSRKLHASQSVTFQDVQWQQMQLALVLFPEVGMDNSVLSEQTLEAIVSNKTTGELGQVFLFPSIQKSIEKAIIHQGKIKKEWIATVQPAFLTEANQGLSVFSSLLPSQMGEALKVWMLDSKTFLALWHKLAVDKLPMQNETMRFWIIKEVKKEMGWGSEKERSKLQLQLQQNWNNKKNFALPSSYSSLTQLEATFGIWSEFIAPIVSISKNFGVQVKVPTELAPIALQLTDMEWVSVWRSSALKEALELKVKQEQLGIPTERQWEMLLKESLSELPNKRMVTLLKQWKQKKSNWQRILSWTIRFMRQIPGISQADKLRKIVHLIGYESLFEFTFSGSKRQSLSVRRTFEQWVKIQKKQLSEHSIDLIKIEILKEAKTETPLHYSVVFKAIEKVLSRTEVASYQAYLIAEGKVNAPILEAENTTRFGQDASVSTKSAAIDSILGMAPTDVALNEKSKADVGSLERSKSEVSSLEKSILLGYGYKKWRNTFTFLVENDTTAWWMESKDKAGLIKLSMTHLLRNFSTPFFRFLWSKEEVFRKTAMAFMNEMQFVQFIEEKIHHSSDSISVFVMALAEGKVWASDKKRLAFFIYLQDALVAIEQKQMRLHEIIEMLVTYLKQEIKISEAKILKLLKQQKEQKLKSFQLDWIIQIIEKKDQISGKEALVSIKKTPPMGNENLTGPYTALFYFFQTGSIPSLKIEGKTIGFETLEAQIVALLASKGGVQSIRRLLQNKMATSLLVQHPKLFSTIVKGVKKEFLGFTLTQLKQKSKALSQVLPLTENEMQYHFVKNWVGVFLVAQGGQEFASIVFSLTIESVLENLGQKEIKKLADSMPIPGLTLPEIAEITKLTLPFVDNFVEGKLVKKPGQRLADAAVVNAGIVLIAPYLPRLFSMLNMLDKKQFKDTETAIKGVKLLHFLVTGSAEFKEQELTIAKILCGVPQEIAILELEAPDQAAIELTEQMLKGVIANWSKLQSTTIEGLRESFLQRGGFLSEISETFQLKMEMKGLDVLLDYVPWSYKYIKFAWMPKPIQVEWR